MLVSNGGGSCDAHSQPEDAVHGRADVCIWISNLSACICMLALQYLLLKIHRLRTVLPAETIPSASELWTAVGLFWVCQIILDIVGLAVLRTLLGAISNYAPVGQRSAANARGVWWTESGGRPVFDRILVSWILHQGLVSLLDVIIPFSRDRQRNPQRVFTNLLSRVHTLVHFFLAAACGSFSTSVPQLSLKALIQDATSNSRTTGQTVRLLRNQTDHPNEGQRTLAWTLVVNKDAMDEMKETLGPPGGFGELGFSVAGDGVRFEAMGVGTSFVLGFEIGVEVEIGGVEEERATMSRRKTK